MARQVQVRSYKKRTKSGKLVTISGYTRNYKGKKTTINEPAENRSSPRTQRGDELRAKIAKNESLSSQELREWNSTHRYEAFTDNKEFDNLRKQRDRNEARQSKEEYNVPNKPAAQTKPTESSRTTSQNSKKSIFDHIEDRLDKFTKKYSGKSYKRRK